MTRITLTTCHTFKVEESYKAIQAKMNSQSKFIELTKIAEIENVVMINKSQIVMFES